MVEGVAVLLHIDRADHEFNYAAIDPAPAFVRSRAKLNFLDKFHKLIQVSASHYTLEGDASERLMLKYYEYLHLDGLPVVPAAGGWSLLLDVAALDLDCVEVSESLLEHKVAATAMRGWGGEVADRHVRFVFSNEPVHRLALLGTRVRAALAAARQRTNGVA